MTVNPVLSDHTLPLRLAMPVNNNYGDLSGQNFILPQSHNERRSLLLRKPLGACRSYLSLALNTFIWKSIRHFNGLSFEQWWRIQHRMLPWVTILTLSLARASLKVGTWPLSPGCLRLLIGCLLLECQKVLRLLPSASLSTNHQQAITFRLSMLQDDSSFSDKCLLVQFKFNHNSILPDNLMLHSIPAEIEMRLPQGLMTFARHC